MAQPTEGLRRFTRNEFLSMAERGVLDPDEHLELLAGQIHSMTPQSPEHSNATTAISDALRAVYPAWFRLKLHSPLDCGIHDLPEPDIAVVCDDAFMRERRHPRGSETHLVVEVSKSTLKKDRAKASVYADGKVPFYWLIDLESRSVEVYRLADRVDRRAEVASQHIAVPGTSVVWTVDYLLSLAGF